jgi:predicted ABC-type ATPase/DNA-binding phage protein
VENRQETPAELLLRVGRRVRSARRDLTWSRKHLSERAGLSERFLAQVEAGTGNPSLKSLAAIASALGITPVALLEPHLEVVALLGLRGAGKSTVGGAAIREHGADYFNPDEATRRIRTANPDISQKDANIAAWQEGKRLLEKAIASRLVFAFETTLGGETMTGLLQRAIAEGIEVRVWYVALTTPELHVARVRARVAQGGHDIPEQKIRERYDQSRNNLIRLLPDLTELRVFDNSIDGDPSTGSVPAPLLVLHMVHGTVTAMCALPQVPEWAKPIVAVAIRSSGS